MCRRRDAGSRNLIITYAIIGQTQKQDHHLFALFKNHLLAKHIESKKIQSNSHKITSWSEILFSYLTLFCKDILFGLCLFWVVRNSVTVSCVAVLYHYYIVLFCNAIQWRYSVTLFCDMTVFCNIVLWRYSATLFCDVALYRYSVILFSNVIKWRYSMTLFNESIQWHYSMTIFCDIIQLHFFVL